jgi:hypothetical protein
MDATRRGKSMWSVKNILVLGEYILEVIVHRGYFNGLNGMELGNNARMPFFE